MKPGIFKLVVKCLFCLLLLAVVLLVLFLHPDAAIKHALEETRNSLHQKGFKTDLSDFDFSVPAADHIRADNLIAAAQALPGGLPERLDLMPLAGSNSVVILWQEDQVRIGDSLLRWPELHSRLDPQADTLDAACAATDGPLRFPLNASQGAAMTLPHLTLLRNLCRNLTQRTMLDLNEGHADAAWTNLFAATRLVTAW